MRQGRREPEREKGWRQRGKAAVDGTGDGGRDKQSGETKAQGALVKEEDSGQG